MRAKICVKYFFSLFFLMRFFSIFALLEPRETLYLGAIAMEEGRTETAKSRFEEVYRRSDCPDEALIARYLAFQIAEKAGDGQSVQAHRKALFEQFRESPLTEEALIVQELPKEAFQAHMRRMETLFPDSPYLSLLWYKKGLNLIAQMRQSEAVSYLERAEKQLIDHPLEESGLLEKVTITKIDCFLELARGAKGSKKSIYYKLAQEALEPLGQEAPAKLLRAQLLFDQGDHRGAQQLADALIHQCVAEQISKSQELALAHQLLAKIHRQEGRLQESMDELEAALEAYLPDQEPLDLPLTLHIARSSLLKEMGDCEGALKTLSSAINAPIISPLRVEAMKMRADLFDSMGRKDLAKRQQLALIEAQRGDE